MKKVILLVLFLSLITSNSWPSIIYIPQDFATIQSGIENAIDGDTVLVSPGDYEECVDFMGKAITVTSNFLIDGDEEFITSTRILGAECYGVIRFTENEAEASQLIGLTVSTAYESNNYSPGIYCSNASPTIMYCEISGNHGVNGGGIRLSNSNAVLKHLSIVNNIANDESELFSGSGGGIDMSNSCPTIEDLYIAQNYAINGAAINVGGYSNPSFVRCIISNNTTEFGSVIGCGIWAETTFINCTIVENDGMFLFTTFEDYTFKIVNSIIYYNSMDYLLINDTPMLINYSNLQFDYESIGNIQEPPLFVDLSNDDFNLQEDSPCINAGINDTIIYYNAGLDSLIIQNNRYYGSGVDMGMIEYIPVDGIFGDINQDLVIDVLDIVGLIQIILGFEEQTDYHLYYCDINNDHILDILDIVAIVEIILCGEG